MKSRQRKFFLTLLMTVLLLDTTRATSQSQVLRIGVIEFTPLVIFEKDQPEGPFYQYVRKILNKAALPMEFREVSIQRALTELKSNSLDLAFSLFKSTERQAYINFSNVPLLAVSTGFCTLQDIQKKPLKATSTMAHMQGMLLPPKFQAFHRIPVSGDNAQIRMLQMLQSARVDAVYISEPGVLILAARQAQMNLRLYCYEILNQDQAIYFAFSKNLAKPILEKINRAIQQQIREESFETYLNMQLSKLGAGPSSIETISSDHLTLR